MLRRLYKSKDGLVHINSLPIHNNYNEAARFVFIIIKQKCVCIIVSSLSLLHLRQEKYYQLRFRHN